MTHIPMNFSHDYLKDDTSFNKSWLFLAGLIGGGLIAGFLTQMGAAQHLKWTGALSRKLFNKKPDISHNDNGKESSSSLENPLSQKDNHSNQISHHDAERASILADMPLFEFENIPSFTGSTMEYLI